MNMRSLRLFVERIPFPFLLLLPLMALTAWNSVGFHHFDEYGQVTEFAGSKLGRSNAATLPWEYGAHLRSWLQPGILVAISNACRWVGLENPFLWTFLFRLGHGLLAWLALFFLWKSLPYLGIIRDRQAGVAWLFCFAFFTPYLLVRPSSEMASATFLVLGACAVFLAAPGSWQEKNQAIPARAILLSGFAFGTAFLFRYQTAAVAIGFCLWLWVHARSRWKVSILFSLAALFVVSLGPLIDFWGYGEWTLAPANYLYQTLVLKKANLWGVKPFWSYLYLSAQGPFAPLIMAVLAGAFLFWLRRPVHPLTWAMLPFFLMHSAIAHKETRYVYPLVWFALACLALVLAMETRPVGPAWTLRMEAALSRLGEWVWQRRKSVGMKIILGLNFLGLLFFAFSPVRPELALQRHLHDLSQKSQGGLEVWVEGTSPYENIAGVTMSFYRPAGLTLRKGSFMEYAASVASNGQPAFHVRDGLSAPEVIPGALRPVRNWSSFPPWVANFNFGRWLDRTPHWSVWTLPPAAAPVSK